MFRNIARISAPMTLAVSVLLVELSGGCGHDVMIAATYDAAPPPAPFTDPDAGDVADEDAGLILYCASSACPPGYTTCPGSRFQCDVDLRNDMNNCGACGSKCPTLGANGEKYTCADGRCVYGCVFGTLDCDGLPDNGCETQVMSEGNCSECGEVCPADKPCVLRGPAGPIGCGCADGKMACPTGLPFPYDKTCVDVDGNDDNCGGCGVACDPTDGGKTPPPNAYYGCRERQCGKLKCKGGFGDCDGDPENGCETPLGTDENCLVCGDACAAGTRCARNSLGIPFCACADGTTFCESFCVGDICTGECRNTMSDPDNCGGCGIQCRAGAGADGEQMRAVCEYGSCRTICTPGTADCNDVIADGCETNTNSDPENCGGCGTKCDAAIGQACVNGQCAVEPCDVPDDAGVAR